MNGLDVQGLDRWRDVLLSFTVLFPGFASVKVKVR